jgi:hypothetical protein
MADVLPIRKPLNAAESGFTDARAEGFALTIRQLFTELPLPDKERVHSQLTEILRPIPAPKAGDVLGAIIYLLPKRPEWSVQELKGLIDDYGIEATTKEIYNALGYLTRHSKIQRIGHGRYSIGGIPVITSDDLGGAPSRNEEHDAN